MPRNGDQFFPFRQNSDFFYLTGISQEKSILLLCPDHLNIKFHEILIILTPDQRLETWNGLKLTQTEARQISGIQQVCWMDEYDQILREIVQPSEYIYLNLPENPRFLTEVQSRDQRNAKTLMNLFPLHHYERLAPLLTSVRIIKEHQEINIMRHACSITEKGFERVLHFVRPGVYEYEVEAELCYEFGRNGTRNHAFHPIIASGKNACFLHYTSNQSICKNGDLLLLDFGAEFANYASDCSRTIPVNGRFTERQKLFYRATLNIFNKVKSMMTKGTSIALINKQTGKFWEEEHVKLGLYSLEDLKHQEKENPLYTKYFMHGVSHFLGMDVHDVGSQSTTLEPGMVLTCEPGIYLADEGLGIRLETNMLITENEPIDLMQNMPVEIEDIEDKMKVN
jgi:Xaa-Pro aminopeptidase